MRTEIEGFEDPEIMAEERKNYWQDLSRRVLALAPNELNRRITAYESQKQKIARMNPIIRALYSLFAGDYPILGGIFTNERNVYVIAKQVQESRKIK